MSEHASLRSRPAVALVERGIAPGLSLARDVALAPVDASQCVNRSARRWSTSRNWIVARFAMTLQMGIASLEETAKRMISRQASDEDAPPRIAVIHFANGDELVVCLDPENADYLDQCLSASRRALRYGWFETLDGCFVALNLHRLNAVFWHTANPETALPSPWDHDNMVVHYVDKEAVPLGRISGSEIDLLHGTTMSKKRTAVFHTVHGQNGEQTSIGIENVTYITMPAVWLDDDA